ncbi:hypothetical protein [Rubritalea squalenifaciens]|uniref:hypothetical protein n=1 Tax=Rubritalea squalenifaciens TaxID=407226 RepID=UPI0013566C81|nr:hypothetical protein [Rubritalea squalenifaciens]
MGCEDKVVVEAKEDTAERVPEPTVQVSDVKLSVQMVKEYEFDSGLVMKVLELVPQGNVNGVLRVLRIQDGKAEEMQSLKFTGMYAPSSVALMESTEVLDFAYDIKASSTGRKYYKVEFPENAEKGGTSTKSAQLDLTSEECVIWERSFYVGGVPKMTSTTVGRLEESLSESREYPNRVQFVVVVKIE